jgi:uncharacterized protein (TIGR01777 family)
MKVLVTGATGFVGKALTRKLVEKGYEVVILSRSARKAHETFSDLNITVAQWDAKTSQGWAHHADGAYAIINLAGESIIGLWTQSKKQALLQSRLDTAAAVTEAVRTAKTKPKVVLHGSAICYPSDTPQPCDESSSYGNSFLSEVTKHFEEKITEVPIPGIRLVLVRTGIVLGKGGGALEPMVKSFKWFLGGYFGDGKQWLSWISLNDEVGAILFLMEREDLSGVFNLVAPQPLIMKEYCRILGKVLKRPCLFSIPAFAARIALGQLADELLLSGQNTVPKRLLEAGYVFKHTSAEQALTEILLKT